MSDLREALAAAIDDDTTTGDETTGTSAPEADTSEPARRDVSGPEHGEVVGEATEVSSGTVRDALGRFVPKSKAPETGDTEPAAAPGRCR